jgi:5-methylcytosine-specific restriction endonuclease McrA
MQHIKKRNCDYCGKYYEGRGNYYCSNSCCKKDKKYQIKRGLSLKGRPSWNKGLHTKLNDALKLWNEGGGIPWNRGLKGIHFSIETEFKPGQTSRENNINWRGGITKENDLIRKSKEYKVWRNQVYKRDNWTCQHCLIKCNSNSIVAHHIYYFSWVPALRFTVKNGITLCRSCHLKLHKKNNILDDLFELIVHLNIAYINKKA